MNLALIAFMTTRYSSGIRENLTNIHAFQCLQRSSFLFVHRAEYNLYRGDRYRERRREKNGVEYMTGADG